MSGTLMACPRPSRPAAFGVQRLPSPYLFMVLRLACSDRRHATVTLTPRRGAAALRATERSGREQPASAPGLCRHAQGRNGSRGPIDADQRVASAPPGDAALRSRRRRVEVREECGAAARTDP